MSRGRAIPALACAIALAGGCTQVSTTGASSGSAHRHVLRIVNLSEPDTLDPIVGNEQIDTDLAYLWGGAFFNLNDQSKLEPELATVEPTLANGGISKDGKTIVYHLHPGVLWQDGRPFTADDVVFTWHAIMNRKNNVPSTVGYELITAIDVRDPHTIAVHLRKSFAPFVSTFFGPSGTPYPVLPKHLLGALPNINQIPFNSQPIGTGPFVLERWQRGNKIVFKANPHYWRGRPKLDEITYTPIPDENTVLTLLQSHEADVEFNLSSNNYRQATKISGYDVILTPFTQYGQLALNLQSSQLGDVRVRRAIWTAIDSKAIVHDVSHDVNRIAYSDQPSFLAVYDPNVAHYDYDPKKAAALLDAAGWKPGPDGIRAKGGARLSLTLAGATGSASGNAVNVLVQRYLHDVGIELTVKTYPTSLYFASYGAGGILQTGKFDLAFLSWINGVDPDDSTLFMCDQFPPAGQNIYHFCDKRLDAAEATALSSNDPVLRKKAYFTIQTILADQVPMIVSWFNQRVSVVSKDVKNYRPAHAVSSFWNSYDWDI